MISAIRSACISHSAIDVEQIAHKFKSSARAIGANALADLCQAMEHLGNDGDLSIIQNLEKQIEEEVEAVIGFINELNNDHT